MVEEISMNGIIAIKVESSALDKRKDHGLESIAVAASFTPDKVMTSSALGIVNCLATATWMNITGV